jgi:capsular exopolysaccharide synthesis family protein
VSLLRKRASPMLISVSAPTSQPAEAYRSLRTSLQFVRHDRPLRTLLVTSPSASDGKTTVVVNLGAVFAQAGARVVLLSCDLRRPGLSQFIAPSEHAELSSVLTGEQLLERAVTPVPGVENLWALGARAHTGNPTELLAGQRMRAVVSELAQQFDLVLIDSPPVLPVADAMILSSYADAVLLVVASGQTRRGELRRTAEKLAQANAPVVGAVLNKATAQEEYGYYGSYQPYVLPGNAAADGGAARNGHSKQNGAPLPSGQPGRLDR